MLEGRKKDVQTQGSQVRLNGQMLKADMSKAISSGLWDKWSCRPWLMTGVERPPEEDHPPAFDSSLGAASCSWYARGFSDEACIWQVGSELPAAVAARWILGRRSGLSPIGPLQAVCPVGLVLSVVMKKCSAYGSATGVADEPASDDSVTVHISSQERFRSFAWVF